MIAGIPIGEFMYFMLWAWLGQNYMLIVQIKKYFPRIKSEGGFAPEYWIRDNFWRIVITFTATLALSPLAVLVAIKAPDGLTEFACIGAGAIIDQTVESFTNKKK